MKILVALIALAGLCGCLEAADEAVLRELNEQGLSKGNVFPGREDYYGAFVLDPNNAWVVGGRGVILSITDQGKTFTMQHSGVERALYDVDFRDLQNGLVSGQDGLILRTTDGGTTWNTIQLELPLEDWQVSQPHIFEISRGADPKKVWGVGPVGTIVYSDDDGQTWQNRSLGRDVNLNGVSFVSDTEGWTSGEFGSILHTLDAGQTWQAQTTVHDLPKYTRPELSEEEAIRQRIPPLYLEDVFLLAVDFRNAKEGYVTGESGILLRTDDGGENWTNVPSGSFNTLLSVSLSPNGKRDDVITGVLGTLALDEDGEWTLNDEVREHVLTWIRVAAFAPDGSFGLACGGRGSILQTTDGGRVWSVIDRKMLARVADLNPSE